MSSPKFLKTNLAGKVKNLPHFKSEALLPLFEAVINAIQAIQEQRNVASGEIAIHVIREKQAMLGNFDIPKINGFTIIDNGVGFNSINYDSFETSDTTHKLALGGKGVGRFLWLKAFDSVSVDSVFVENGRKMCRTFSFTTSNGIDQKSIEETNKEQLTFVQLNNFKKEYQQLPSAFKTTEKIAQRILEHCLSYFISGNVPKITIIDGDETITLNYIFDTKMKNNITINEIKINGKTFKLAHIKLYSTQHEKMHNIVLCANNRDVKSINISRVLGTSSQFDESDKKFTYALYVTSPYLDETVDTYRMDFDIPDEESLLSKEKPVSQKQLDESLAAAVREFLKEFLAKVKLKKEEIVAKFVSDENPSLRAVPYYCPEVYDDFEPNSSPEKINEALYRHKGKAEYEIKRQSDTLLKTQNKSVEEMEESYQKLTSQLTDFQKDNLAQYICNRKRIIMLLEKKLEQNSDGKYSNEDIVHDIIFPRKAMTHEITFEDHNLWVLDERLAFHAFAASDKPLNQITDSLSTDRPDIIAFAEIDDDKIARAVSIIEFKKPQRANFDEDPISQLYRYLGDIKDGKGVKLPNGRQLHVSEMTRFYCYAICDINDKIKKFVTYNGNFSSLKGELGYYTYNSILKAHTEILHFDKIVVDAKQRHKAFFEKLGIH